jgi:hypothetical protein
MAVSAVLNIQHAERTKSRCNDKECQMSKFNHLRLAIAAVTLLAAGSSVAANTISGSDGCAILRQIIAAQFGAISTSGSGDQFDIASRSMTIVPDTPLLCATTAASVSRAFGTAMNDAGIAVSWGGTVPLD